VEVQADRGGESAVQTDGERNASIVSLLCLPPSDGRHRQQYGERLAMIGRRFAPGS
jgi:hypothetical protein